MPHNEEKSPNRSKTRTWIGILIAFFAALVVLGALVGDDIDPEEPRQPETQAPTPDSPDGDNVDREEPQQPEVEPPPAGPVYPGPPEQQAFMELHEQYSEELDAADHPLQRQEIEENAQQDLLILDETKSIESWEGELGFIQTRNGEFAVRIDAEAETGYEISFSSVPIIRESPLFEGFRTVERGDCIAFSGDIMVGPLSAVDAREFDQWHLIMRHPLYAVAIQSIGPCEN